VSARPAGSRTRTALAVAGVAAVGVLGGHELGYLVGAADGTVTTPHAHLDALLGAAPVAAAWLLLAAALTDPRRGWTRELTVTRLVTAQAGLYAALEIGERLAHGVPLAELASVAVVSGLVAQVVVAGVAILLARAGQSLVGHLLRRPRPRATTPALSRPVGDPVDVPAGSRRPRTAPSRGPPLPRLGDA
jgi:hypothetical protein